MDVKVTPQYDDTFGGTIYSEVCREKRKDPFFITPHPKGYSGWVINAKTGELPAALSGTFSRYETALQALKLYFSNMKPTQVTKRKLKEES